RFDTLGRGESLQSLLRRGGFSDDDAAAALQAATTLDARRIPAGMPVTIKAEAADSSPNEVTLQLSIDRLLHLKRNGDTWTGTEEKLAWALADVYEYRVDMSRDLQVGDEFKVVAERSVAPTGAMRIGKVIAATFK